MPSGLRVLRVTSMMLLAMPITLPAAPAVSTERKDSLEQGFAQPPPAANELRIDVTNLWVNRLIGDQQPGAARKYTFTTMPFYKAGSPLLSSGLLGPVELQRVTRH